MSTRKQYWMIPVVGAVFFLVAAGSTAAAGGPPAAPDDSVAAISPADITAFVDQYVQEEMAAAHAPGLVVTVVHQGQVVLARGYGLADLETGRPMTPQTPLRAGSVSKPVTSAAVLQLAAAGLLDLNSPVSAYVTDLPLEDSYGPAGTVAQFLTLKGGYPDTVVQTHAANLADWQPLDQYLAGNLPSRVIPPGKVHSYNSWEHALLGQAMAQVTGLTFDQAMAQYLFEPLGMGQSTFTQPLPNGIAADLAAGYYYTGGQYEPVPLDYVQLSPGIALVTTGEDMGRFMLALLDGGRLAGAQVLSPDTSEGLLTRQEAVHAYSRGRTYGLGEVNLSGRQALYQDGNGISQGNRLILIPEQQLGIFLSVNHRPLAPDISDTPAYRFMKGLSTALLERYVPASDKVIPTVQPLSDAKERAPRYAGHYRKAGVPQEDFFKLDALLDNVNVRDNGDGTITIGSNRYQEVDPLLFQSQTDPGYFVVFAEDDQGQVELLTFGGTGAYQKVRWYERFNVQAGLAVAMVVVFLSFAIAMPFSDRRHWLLWAVSLLNILFLAGLGAMMFKADLLLFFKTIPVGTRLLFLLPWISGLLTLATAPSLIRLWGEPLGLWVKVHSLLTTLAAFSFVWFVYYWNIYLK